MATVIEVGHEIIIITNYWLIRGEVWFNLGRWLPKRLFNLLSLCNFSFIICCVRVFNVCSDAMM